MDTVSTGEEHALVRDDSYRDVSQILSLWAPDSFVVPWILSLMQLHVTKNTSKNHYKCIQYFIFKYNMLYFELLYSLLLLKRNNSVIKVS